MPVTVILSPEYDKPGPERAPTVAANTAHLLVLIDRARPLLQMFKAQHLLADLQKHLDVTKKQQQPH